MRARSRQGFVVLALVAGGLTAAALPSSSAIAFLSPPAKWKVEVQSPAQLVSNGALADVTVEVTCPAGQAAVVHLDLSQGSGKKGVSGSDLERVSCNGAMRLVHLVVAAEPAKRSWEKGSALADAELFGCNYFCDKQDSDSRKIQLRR